MTKKRTEVSVGLATETNTAGSVIPSLSGWGELYLQETGLTAEEALEAASLEQALVTEQTDSLVDLRRLSKRERDELKAAQNLLIALHELVIVVGTQMPAEERPPLQLGDKEGAVWPRPDRAEKDLRRLRRFVTEEQVEAARGVVVRRLKENGVVNLSFNSPLSVHLELPDAREARATYERLIKKAAITPEQAQKRLDALLAGCPPLSKWLKARGAEDRFGWAHRELENLLRDELARLRRELERAKRPRLRKGTATLRNLLTTETHVDKVRRRGRASGRALTSEQAEAFKLFRYQPLGWSERLSIHGLATIANEQGLLDSHPWAKTSRPIAGHPKNRIRLEYPGTTELARVIGYAENKQGKIGRSDRRTVERALRQLCTLPRWIAVPVLVPPAKKGGDWMDDVEITQTLWVEAATTVFSQGVYLNLHPAAFTSHLRSFLEVEALASAYKAARDALGYRQMRDEWAIADDYVRWRAICQVVGGARELAPAEPGTTVEQLTLEVKVKDDRLLQTLGLWDLARKQGRPTARQRTEDALAFCRQMGTLLDAELEGEVWTLTVPHPDARATTDGGQYVLLTETGSPK